MSETGPKNLTFIELKIYQEEADCIRQHFDEIGDNLLHRRQLKILLTQAKMILALGQAPYRPLYRTMVEKAIDEFAENQDVHRRFHQ